MKGNAYTGDVPVRVPGWPALTLRYDWEAIAALQRKYRGEALRAALIGLQHDVEGLLHLAAVGLQAHHRGMSEEDLRRLPAAIAPLTDAVREAISLAYAGPEEARPENPRRRTHQGRMMRPLRAILSWRPFATRTPAA